MGSVEFCGELTWETDKSYKVNDGAEDLWIPKSLVEEKRRVGSSADFIFVIPEWFAKREGII
jgi:hypothetical protein